jgi:Zn-dependent alcohol dehydrogenase
MDTSAVSTQGIVSWGRLSDGEWRMSTMKVRKPGDGELLVEMIASGVCHTDLLIGNLPEGASPVGFYPRVLGHEGIYNLC